MKFDLEKAKAGHPVEIVIHKDEFGNDVWFDIGEVNFIGVDSRGYVYYEFPVTHKVISNHVNILRMKKETVRWWFRTWVYNTGVPVVEVGKSPDVYYELHILNDGSWLNDPWYEDI